MNFIGIKKVSMVDYPANIATTVFTGGCDFNCKYCHNHKLINPKKEDFQYNEDDVIKFLKTRKKLIDALCISGGEPTLYKNHLIKFIKRVKNELDIKIKVDVNGSNFDVIKNLISCVDYIAIDLKSLDYSQFSNIKLTDVMKSINEIRKSKIDYEVRMTMYPLYISLKDYGKYSTILKSVKNIVLQQYNSHNSRDKKIRSYSEQEINDFALNLKKLLNKNQEIVIRGI